MLLRILDFATFDQELDIPDGITVSDLYDLLRSTFDYNFSHCGLYHKGQELSPGTRLTPSIFSDSNLIAMHNSALLPYKSFPKVDRAFSFRSSRFQEAFFPVTSPAGADGPERVQEQQRRHLEAFYSLNEDFPMPMDPEAMVRDLIAERMFLHEELEPADFLEFGGMDYE